MTADRHCIAGFFGDFSQAQATQIKLNMLGLQRDRLRLFEKHAQARLPAEGRAPQAGSDAALKDMLIDGAIGGVIGGIVGALVWLAILWGDIGLFMVSPFLAPFMMIGWGVGAGATIGAMVGAQKREPPLAAMIRDAVSHGQTVLLVDAESELETDMAREAMQGSASQIREIDVAR
jgi:hypothetical protein